LAHSNPKIRPKILPLLKTGFDASRYGRALMEIEGGSDLKLYNHALQQLHKQLSKLLGNSLKKFSDRIDVKNPQVSGMLYGEQTISSPEVLALVPWEQVQKSIQSLHIQGITKKTFVACKRPRTKSEKLVVEYLEWLFGMAASWTPYDKREAMELVYTWEEQMKKRGENHYRCEVKSTSLEVNEDAITSNASGILIPISVYADVKIY